VEQIAVEARQSEYVDAKSGVSARLTITAYENLISTAERRALLHGEAETTVRMTDFWGVVPSITGKIELVYEGEQEGPAKVAQILIGKAIRAQFVNFFPDPEKVKKETEVGPYQKIVTWFARGNQLDLFNDMSCQAYEKTLLGVPGLVELVKKYHPQLSEEDQLFLMEFALHGLAEYSFLSKHLLEGGLAFRDLLSSMLPPDEGADEETGFKESDFF